jgi:hypothetical protein
MSMHVKALRVLILLLLLLLLLPCTGVNSLQEAHLGESSGLSMLVRPSTFLFLRGQKCDIWLQRSERSCQHTVNTFSEFRQQVFFGESAAALFSSL